MRRTTQTNRCQRSATVDVDTQLVTGLDANAVMGLRADVLRHMDDVAERTKADIFLCNPKPLDIESASINGNLESSIDNRFRIVIYGDMEVCEHAKTRILIMIDQIVLEYPTSSFFIHTVC